MKKYNKILFIYLIINIKALQQSRKICFVHQFSELICCISTQKTHSTRKLIGKWFTKISTKTRIWLKNWNSWRVFWSFYLNINWTIKIWDLPQFTLLRDSIKFLYSWVKLWACTSIVSPSKIKWIITFFYPLNWWKS